MQKWAQKWVVETRHFRGLSDSISPSPSKTWAPLTWALPPGSDGQRGEPGDTSKSLSSSASPSARGRLQGPGGGHGCSMPNWPQPYNRHCQRTWREWNLLRLASRPSQPGPLPRIPLPAATPTHTRAGLAAQPADSGRRSTQLGASLPGGRGYGGRGPGLESRAWNWSVFSFKSRKSF